MWKKMVESQVFFPESALAGAPDSWGMAFEDQWIATEGGQKLHGWWIPAEKAEAALLFCHGNAGNISHRLDNLARLNRRGLSVLIFDYRGYGRSQGSPSEAGFYADAQSAFHAAEKRARGEGLKLVVFGRSLGGVAAARLSRLPQAAGVIIESSFTHLGDMAQSLLPLPGLKKGLAHMFNAEKDIKLAKAPLLFIHGDADDIAPYRLGQKLYQAAPGPKRFITLPGAGHNDTYLAGGSGYFDAIMSFIRGLPGSGGGAEVK